jgi:group II intron reverse transcriptase/maturase
MKLVKAIGAKGLACSRFKQLTTINGMIDYFETKTQPITRVMVWKAYWKIRSNKGGMGVDEMSWADLDKVRNKQLYKLWNRLSSGSYFPPPVKEVGIKKKDGGIRKLGIPTILDRIAQEVVREQLNSAVEPLFHNSSFGYRQGRNAHQAIKQAMTNALSHKWAVDLDIKGFFDTIDHALLMKAVSHYCKDKWVLLYTSRWLKAGIITEKNEFINRMTGTPQGGVISPLLSNLFLHVVFDKWMQLHHPTICFERYADDIVIHCNSENQSEYILKVVGERMNKCNLELHPQKTKIVHFRGVSKSKYPRSLDFLGFTLKAYMARTKVGSVLMPNAGISQKSKSSILKTIRDLKIHKMRTSIEEIAQRLSPMIRGWINYYCKFRYKHTKYLWFKLDVRLVKWVSWEKGMNTKAALRWLKDKYLKNPNLFPHWELVHP